MKHLLEIETLTYVRKLIKDNFCYQCKKDCNDCKVKILLNLINKLIEDYEGVNE